MSDFITIKDYDASIHKEILDSLIREDATDDTFSIEVCEDRAVEQVKSYLKAIYDVDKIFSAHGPDRNSLILMVTIDIAIYHIFTIHNPYKISQIRKDRYNQAIEWLQSVADHTLTIPDAPLLPDETLAENSRWLLESDELRSTRW